MTCVRLAAMLLLTALGLPASSAAALQSPAPVPPTVKAPALPSGNASPAPAGDDEYRVGVGDVLEVTVFGNDDLTRASTVQTNGAMALPLLGEVAVAQLTVAEVKRKLTQLYGRDYLVNPQVDVKVRDYQSRFVTVLGEVNSPGRKALRGRTRLIDVLVEAGGFSPRASGDVVLNRSDGTLPGGENVLRVRLTSAAPGERERAALELPLRHGDVITASPKFYVTVEGEVQRPGRYALDADLTVTGAVSTAGGLTRFGSHDVRVRRLDPDTGQSKIIPVDLKAVRSGKQPDLALLPNDVITISRRLF
jgi:polysaccharide export outer membrane protein